MGSGDDADEVYADNETGYDGTILPVNIEDIDHTHGPAVILGALRQGDHIITADSVGVLVVESVVPRNGTVRAPQ